MKIINIFLIFFIAISCTIDVQEKVNDAKTKSSEGKYEEAIKIYSRVIKVDKFNPVWYNNRGVNYAAVNDNEKAEIDFLASILIDSNYILPLYNLAKLKFQQNLLTESKNYCDKIIIKDNSHFDAYLLRGRIYSALREYELSLEDYYSAISLDSTNIAPYFLRGKIYYQNSEFDKCISDFNQVIYLDQFNEDAYLYLADCYAIKGDLEKAIKTFSEIISLGCNNAQIYYENGRLEYLLGEYNKAELSFTNAIAIEKTSMSYSMRGVTRKQLGNLDDAKSDYLSAIMLDSTNATTFYNLAILELEFNDTLNSCKYFHQAFELGDNDAKYFIETYCE